MTAVNNWGDVWCSMADVYKMRILQAVLVLPLAHSCSRSGFVRRVAPSELSALYPKDWHDNGALRNSILSRVSELVSVELLGASSAKASLALQKRIYTNYLHRFVLSPLTSESALLVAQDADGVIVGSCCCGVAAATADGRKQDEPLVQRDGSPSLRPAWPLPWDRSDPLAVARALLGGQATGSETAEPGGAEATYEPRALLDGLVVSSSSRRAGIGRALVAEAEALARSWGHATLLLRVEASNTHAREFYARLGYAVPSGCEEVVSGRKLVADNWGCKWVAGKDTPLERSF